MFTLGIGFCADQDWTCAEIECLGHLRDNSEYGFDGGYHLHRLYVEHLCWDHDDDDRWLVSRWVPITWNNNIRTYQTVVFELAEAHIDKEFGDG